MRRGYRLKRAADIVVSVVLILTLAIPMIGIALAIRVKMGSPVLFHQQRPGLHSRPFTLSKFRTMSDATGPDGSLLPDAQRLTALGRFLRETTLDELPELFNVLKGDMSLVGPRPLLAAYLGRYTPDQARRHDVKPGLTGWAVVHGRNALNWQERLQLDVWYVDNLSFWLDLKILFKTISLIFQRKGVSADGHATMPEFLGTDAVNK